MTPRTDRLPTTLSSPAYHCLGLTDFVQLEREARRARARAIAASLKAAWAWLAAAPDTATANPRQPDYARIELEARRLRAATLARGLKDVFAAPPATNTVKDLDRDDLLALGVPPGDIRVALAGQTLGNLLAGVILRLQHAWDRATAEAELRALDDRTLHDMGLSRSDIPAAVAGGIYRPGPASNENSGFAKVQTLRAGSAA